MISFVPRTISQENLITNPYDIASTSNNYFSSVVDTTQENSKYSHKCFQIILITSAIILYLFSLLTVRK